MLNGVGGRTIEEAKLRISGAEFDQWVKYRQIYGSLNPVVAVDRSVGRLSYIMQAAHGGKGKYHDFVPQYELTADEDEPVDADANLAQAMKEWK